MWAVVGLTQAEIEILVGNFVIPRPWYDQFSSTGPKRRLSRWQTGYLRLMGSLERGGIILLVSKATGAL
jgi:hypothetical protein